jgi:hypothetical protein
VQNSYTILGDKNTVKRNLVMYVFKKAKERTSRGKRWLNNREE